MAISYVGGNTNIGTGSSTVTVDLTALTGGSDSSPSTGDLVIVALNYNGSTNANVPPSVSTSGYTNITSLFSDDSNETNLLIARKFMGGTPDTSVAGAVPGGSGSRAFTVAVQVWRGVDTTNPLDVTTTTDTGIDSSTANPPSITPVTSGTYVIAIGANASGNNDTAFNSAPSGYSNFVNSSGSGGTFTRAGVALASKAWTSGAEDPGSFGVNSTNTSSSWAAVTLALREIQGQIFSISETLSLSETVSTLRTRLFSIAETTTLSETISALKGISFTVAESLGLVEAYSYAQTFVFSLADSLGITEVLAQVKKKWASTTRSSSTWTDSTKNTSTWTDTTKNSSTWTDKPKS